MDRRLAVQVVVLEGLVACDLTERHSSFYLITSIEGSAFAVVATHYSETIYPSYSSPRGCGLDVRKYRARPCALSLEHRPFCFLSTPQVTLVGHIVSVQKQATNSVYVLDDGTGTLEARHWSDSTSSQDGEDSQHEVV